MEQLRKEWKKRRTNEEIKSKVEVEERKERNDMKKEES
jgi:hypothetical protein